MKKPILYLIALMSLTGFVNAQNPQWINYTNGDVINALADDGTKLWVGTRGGLVKLDKTNGNAQFYNKANSGLSDNRINSIAVDVNGVIWIGTWNGGLATFDGINWMIYYFPGYRVYL